MVVRWDEAISHHTADKLSSLFVHSAESRTDILEAVPTIWRGARLVSRVPQSFTFPPAVTTIPALGPLEQSLVKSLSSSKTRRKTG
jgi:hypothetical protein